MGIFCKRSHNIVNISNTILPREEQRRLREDLVCRLDTEFLNNWRTDFAENEEEIELAKKAYDDLNCARNWLDGILYKHDNRVSEYARQISVAIDRIKDHYNSLVGATFVANYADIICQKTREWARL